MYSHQEYVMGWAAYAGACFVFLLAWWFLTRKVAFNELRQLLRLIPAVVLLVPWHADADSIYLAPAWVVAFTEGLFEGPEAFWRAGTPLLFALALMLVIVTIVKLLSFFMRERSRDY